MLKLVVKVTPNAKKNAIEGFQEGVLKIKIHAPPDKGKVNEELIAFLAKTFCLPKSQIQIVSGHSSSLKKLEIDGENNGKYF